MSLGGLRTGIGLSALVLIACASPGAAASGEGGVGPAARARGDSSPPAATVVLVPFDDRPAVGPFAGMIAAVADCRVRMPPRELLGRFTQPGDPERIAAGLEIHLPSPRTFEAAVEYRFGYSVEPRR